MYICSPSLPSLCPSPPSLGYAAFLQKGTFKIGFKIAVLKLDAQLWESSLYCWTLKIRF